MEKLRQIEQWLQTKYKTNTIVCQLYLDFLRERYIETEDLPQQLWDKRSKLKFGFIFFIGDTEGNNKWFGHYPGNRKKICCPYRNCKCEYDQQSKTNPQCVYTTLEDMQLAKMIKLNNERKGQDHFKLISWYDIINALTDKYMPLSDDCHGLCGMMPLKLLHTSGSGLILYIFESLRVWIGCGKDRDEVDKYHIWISSIIRCQSEHDFPREAMCNGLVFYFYALHRHWKDQRYCKRDCNIVNTKGWSGLSFWSFICWWKNGLTIQTIG